MPNKKLFKHIKTKMTDDQIKFRFIGNPILKKKASEIKIDDTLQELAAEMTNIMYKYDGVGLAAPQIGISKRIIIVNVPSSYLQNNEATSPGEMLLIPQMPIALINPEIISSGSKTETTDEGCLSVPGIYAPVTRPTAIVLRTQLLSNESIEIECGGLLARILQHEIDHLDGILFVDRLTPEDHKKIEKQLDRLKKQVH